MRSSGAAGHGALKSFVRASLVLSLTLAVGVAVAQPMQDEWPGPGFPAPDFELPDLGGNPIRLAALRGEKAVFLNFWVSSCPPCEQEMLTMTKLYRRFKSRGLEIVAVSIDRSPADAARFAEKHGIPFLVPLDPDLDVADEYRVGFIPAHYFIDRRGVIRAREVGGGETGRGGRRGRSSRTSCGPRNGEEARCQGTGEEDARWAPHILSWRSEG